MVKTSLEGITGAAKPLSSFGYGVCSEAIERYGEPCSLNDTGIKSGGDDSH